MMIDFENKLKKKLNEEIDSANKDMLDEILKTPFAEESPKKRFSFAPKRAVATLCASVLLLCVGVFGSGMLSSGESQQGISPINFDVQPRSIEPESMVSDQLQSVLLEMDIHEEIEVVVLSEYSQEDFKKLVESDVAISQEDLASLNKISPITFSIKLEKASIINTMNYFSFFLPEEN